MDQQINNNIIPPIIKENNTLAKTIIYSLSVVVFMVVVLMGKFKPLVGVDFPFNRFIFAHIIGALNSLVSVLLIIGLIQVKNKNFIGHKRTMLAAIICSATFLVFYIIHHISNADTFMPITGIVLYVYRTILITHIILAAIILPFILFSAYYSLSGQFPAHKKISKITWPIWLYVSVSGVVVYLFISPYYGS